MLARVIRVTCAALVLVFVITGAVYAANVNAAFVSPLASDDFKEGNDLASTAPNVSIPTATATPTPYPSSTPTPSPTSTPTPSPTATPTPMPTFAPVTSADLENYFSKYASEYSVDREQLRRIAACESGYNSRAQNGDYAGMYQFSSSSWQLTRAHMNMDTNTDLRYNPEEAIRTAAYKISSGGAGAWPSCQ